MQSFSELQDEDVFTFDDIEYKSAGKPYYNAGVYGVDVYQTGNAFIKVATESGLLDVLWNLGKNIAVQGELIGGNIQNAGYGIEPTFCVFDIFDIDEQKYLLPAEREIMFNRLISMGAKIRHVPIINRKYLLQSNVISEILLKSEGASVVNTKIQREGLVYKSCHSEFSFKAISNSWLLKND